MALKGKIGKAFEWIEHGKTLVEIALAAGGGTAVKAVLLQYTHIPILWVTPIWLTVSAVLLWGLLRISKKYVQPQANVQASLLPAQGLVSFNAAEHFRTAYYSPLTSEAEKKIRLAAIQNSPDDHEGFLAKIIGIGLVGFTHDITWAYIFRSQILALMEVNRKAGIMPIADAKPFYDKAVADFPNIYSGAAGGSFDEWLSYLKGRDLIIHHPTDMLEITVRGKDFLKYLTHWGRYPDARRG